MKLVLSKVPPRYQITLIAIGIAGFILVIIFYLLLPQRERIDILQNQFELEKQKVAVVEAFATAHPNSEQYLLQLDQQVVHVDRLLPNQPDISDFLLQLDQAAKECGVEIVNIKFSPSVNKKGYRDIPLEILISGDYFKTLNFLSKTENLPRFNSINSVITQSRDEVLETKLTVTIYCFGVAQNQKPAEPAKK
ncbi:MAG: type 4a pilus biogenesis protein PilO [Veillonellaceae bacterium]|jgi:Tfp pilus assembly protein PilO|nr:type 4a pilus biogenesis protein PilO [Veillonellaceae bacterium]